MKNQSLLNFGLLSLSIVLSTMARSQISRSRTVIGIDLIYDIQPHVSSIRYIIKLDTITIIDIQNPIKKDSILIKAALSDRETNQFVDQIMAIRIDTLQTFYDGGGFDGVGVWLKINTDKWQPKSIMLNNFKHPTMDKLFGEINKLIPGIKYRINY